jgi:RNA polymerase sigma-70 factor (ECF subfamily)
VELNEDDLITRARRGDGSAWEVLVRQHQEPAFRLAYLLLGNRVEAEDITQEAFIRAYQSIERFDPSRPFRPWLLAITANLARNQKRSIGRYFAAVRRFRDQVQKPQMQLEPNRLENKVSNQWEAQMIWKAIQKLDDKDQQIIYLRYFLDLPVSETAEILSIAQGTVKSRLSRALGRLEDVIERDFPELREGMAT